MDSLALLSAGAAKGLVLALQQRFTEASGAQLQATFGAVGAIREQWLAGAPCDVIILTEKQIDEMAAAGEVAPATCAPLGRVRTGIAVRAGAPLPAIADADGLRQALLVASDLYLPDPVRATAGIHCVDVLRRLGIYAQMESRLRAFPNGATAMAQLAKSSASAPIGCTQITEILYTPGVTLAGALPAELELSTVYAAAVSGRARAPEAARQLVALLAGPDAAKTRRAGGFEA